MDFVWRLLYLKDMTKKKGIVNIVFHKFISLAIILWLFAKIKQNKKPNIPLLSLPLYFILKVVLPLELLFLVNHIREVCISS